MAARRIAVTSSWCDVPGLASLLRPAWPPATPSLLSCRTVVQRLESLHARPTYQQEHIDAYRRGSPSLWLYRACSRSISGQSSSNVSVQLYGARSLSKCYDVL